ncbi:bacteriohemerythrin [Sulfurospirillum arcachonense]|uniref:bacteriohemerythrin n=1 Tax=Sulfurospirillum arcachonense TaxID=57666 RepID=UPI000468E68D|nr:bacteriohemerythrin [Sulfurospirillum arcachonense]
MIDLTWQEIYSLNNNQIDTEHQKLFQIASKAFTVTSNDKKLDKIRNVLKELLSYTKTHFKNEEQYMESISYPDLETQKTLHNKIIDSMKNFTRKLPKMNLLEIEKELAHLVEIWFIHHIIYEDKKISQWVRTHKIPEFSFCWHNSYSIHNALIDAEHQELFQIASEVFKQVPQALRMEKIKITLHKLFEYFEKHFKNEEIYMESIKFDMINEHKDIHKKIIENLTIFMQKVPTLQINEIEDELKEFINTSLVNHILEEDKKILFWMQDLEDIKNVKNLKTL